MRSKIKVHARASPTPIELENPASAISGRLFIEVDGIYFPAYDWVDMVLPVLGSWLENAMRLRLPGVAVKSTFMDGPQAFSLERSAGSDDVTLTLHHGPKRASGPYMVSYARCLATHRGAARSVLHELEEMGLEGRSEASTLKTRLDHVMRLEAEIKARGLS